MRMQPMGISPKLLACTFCCHALSHLFGQVSDHFSTVRMIDSTKPIPNMDEDAVSFTPESIYHPPRYPSLT